jgi:hypothetical protein
MVSPKPILEYKFFKFISSAHIAHWCAELTEGFALIIQSGYNAAKLTSGSVSLAEWMGRCPVLQLPWIWASFS